MEPRPQSDLVKRLERARERVLHEGDAQVFRRPAGQRALLWAIAIGAGVVTVLLALDDMVPHWFLFATVAGGVLIVVVCTDLALGTLVLTPDDVRWTGLLHRQRVQWNDVHKAGLVHPATIERLALKALFLILLLGSGMWLKRFLKDELVIEENWPFGLAVGLVSAACAWLLVTACKRSAWAQRKPGRESVARLYAQDGRRLMRIPDWPRAAAFDALEVFLRERGAEVVVLGDD